MSKCTAALDIKKGEVKKIRTLREIDKLRLETFYEYAMMAEVNRLGKEEEQNEKNSALVGLTVSYL